MTKVLPISLIDCAIKSVIESPQSNNHRRVYSRSQLLGCKNSSLSQKWPATLDRRFARWKIGCNPNLFPELPKPRPSNDHTFPRHRTTLNQKLDSTSGDFEDFTMFSNSHKKTKRFHDDAIACTLDISYDPSVVSAKEMHLPTQSRVSGPNHWCSPVRAKYLATDPEWFSFGPKNIEESLEFGTCNTVGFSESDCARVSSSTRRVRLSDEKENRRFRIGTTNDTENAEKIQLKDTVQNVVEKTSVRDERHRISERQPSIKTLREIEAKLNVRNSSTKEAGDMSAYYKLLGLIGSNLQSTYQTKLENKDPALQIPSHGLLQSTNNNQPRVPNMGDFAENEENSHREDLYSDPAITDVVPNARQCNQPRISSNGIVKTSKEALVVSGGRSEPITLSPRVSCNPLAASYQRQVMATGPLGQNALRWFRAMTNAASASACISQRLDGPVSATGNNVSPTRHFAEPVADETNINLQTFGFDGKTRNPKNRTEQLSLLTGEQFSATKVADDAAFYALQSNKLSSNMPCNFNVPENTFGTALGLGMSLGLTPRPIKPLMFYCHPQAAQFLNRPMIHPLLLQQLIQKQLDLRNASLHLQHMRQPSSQQLQGMGNGAQQPSSFPAPLSVSYASGHKFPAKLEALPSYQTTAAAAAAGQGANLMQEDREHV